MKLNVLLVLLVVTPSTAMAGVVRDNTWFSLEGSSDSNVTATGGPGQTLVIDKPVSSGTTVLTIGYNFTNIHQFGDPSSMAGWGFTLGPIDLNGGTQNVTAGNEDFTLSQAAGYNLDLLPPPDPDVLFSALAASILGTGADGLVFTFEILIEKQDGTPATTNIFGDLATQVPFSPYAWYGSFGPNTGRYGIPGYNDRTGELPVITINNVVPEPVTIGLLCAGMVLLLGRRRGGEVCE